MKRLTILDDGTKIVHGGLFITPSSPDIVEEYDVKDWSDEDFEKAKRNKKHLDIMVKEHKDKLDKLSKR